ncbi:hypothetical protein PSP6_210308 [Paraburkholderia tropica]|nr:hypothetical protein PSP6_210308 [Paraburkholderia tropica]
MAIPGSKLFIRSETHSTGVKRSQINPYSCMQENPKCKLRQVVDSIHKTYTNISIESDGIVSIA